MLSLVLVFINNMNILKRIFPSNLEKLSQKLFYSNLRSKSLKEITESNLNSIIKIHEKKFSQKVKGKTYRGQDFTFGAMNFKESLLIYSLVRLIQPKKLVETGVCNGVSTAFILLALKNNMLGKLYSIDFPELANKK